MISTNQFRNGSAIRVDGKRFTILYFQHVKPGKGGAFVRTRLRNIDSGALLESAGLPRCSPGVDAEAALLAMSRDKKRSATDGGTEGAAGDTTHRFVLLRDVGLPVYGVPVGDDEARQAIGEIVG